MSVRVTFTVLMDNEPVSFSSVEEIRDPLHQKKVYDCLTKWSRSIREAALRHKINEQLGKEFSQNAQITFHQNNS